MTDEQLLKQLSAQEKKLRTLAEYYLQTESFTVNDNFEEVVKGYNNFILASSSKHLRSIFILIKQEATLDAIIFFRILLENNINIFYGNRRKQNLVKEIIANINIISKNLKVKNNYIFNKKRRVGRINTIHEKVYICKESRNLFWVLYPLINIFAHNNYLTIYFYLNSKDFKFTHREDCGQVIVAALSLYIYCCIFKLVILKNKKEYYTPTYYYRCRKTILNINELLIEAFTKLINIVNLKDNVDISFINRNCRGLRYALRKIVEELSKEIEDGIR